MNYEELKGAMRFFVDFGMDDTAICHSWIDGECVEMIVNPIKPRVIKGEAGNMISPRNARRLEKKRLKKEKK